MTATAVRGLDSRPGPSPACRRVLDRGELAPLDIAARALEIAPLEVWAAARAGLLEVDRLGQVDVDAVAAMPAMRSTTGAFSLRGRG